MNNRVLKLLKFVIVTITLLFLYILTYYPVVQEQKATYSFFKTFKKRCPQKIENIKLCSINYIEHNIIIKDKNFINKICDLIKKSEEGSYKVRGGEYFTVIIEIIINFKIITLQFYKEKDSKKISIYLLKKSGDKHLNHSIMTKDAENVMKEFNNYVPYRR